VLHHTAGRCILQARLDGSYEGCLVFDVQAMALAATAAGVRRVEAATLPSFRRIRAGRATRTTALTVAMCLRYHLPAPLALLGAARHP
jgi:hypothetical protein